MENNVHRRATVVSVSPEELGISIPDPDYGCVRVVPTVDHFGGKEGSVRIPAGLVQVKWENTEELLRMEVVVPVGTHLSMRLPAHLSDQLFIDSEPIAEDTQTVRTENYVDLAILPGSLYVFEVVRSSHP